MEEAAAPPCPQGETYFPRLRRCSGVLRVGSEGVRRGFRGSSGGGSEGVRRGSERVLSEGVPRLSLIHI
eukprot:697952-Alexandrium_andersonii.AAC.1